MVNQLITSLIYLAEPIGFIWFLLILGTLIFIKRKQWLPAIYSVSIAAIMSLIGSTPIPGWLLESLERHYVKNYQTDVPVCDAVVVLGGWTQASRYEANGLDFMNEGDRIIMGIELIKRGKAKNLVLGGSGYYVNGKLKIESELAKQWLSNWRIVNAEIFSLGATENTYDEAVRTRELARRFGWKKLIIVTSAYHLRRAEAVFKSIGIDVVPVPCDFRTSLSIETPVAYTLVPRYQGFIKLSLYIREVVGYYIYYLRGWA